MVLNLNCMKIFSNLNYNNRTNSKVKNRNRTFSKNWKNSRINSQSLMIMKVQNPQNLSLTMHPLIILNFYELVLNLHN